MKYRKVGVRSWYIIIGLLLFTCSHNVQRGPSSVGDNSCVSIMKSFFASAKESTGEKIGNKIIKPALKKLKHHTLKSKLSFLKMLNARRGRFEFLTKMYANTLNKMLTEGIISPEDVPALLTNGTKSKYALDFTYGEVRLINRSWDGLPDLDKTMDMILERSQPSVDQVLGLRKLLSETEFTPVEFNEFQKYFVRFPDTPEEWDLLKEYLAYATSMRSKKQMKAISELPKLFYPEDSGTYIRKFRNIRKNIDKFEVKQVKKQEKKALKKGMSEKEAKTFAKAEARRMTEVYSGLKYACRSTKPTAESKQAAKSTSKFFMGMGITATAGTYAYANWDRDKTKFDWYGKLGHDLAWKFIFQYGYNNIMTDQGATFLKKIISLHVFYTPADYIEAAMYEKEFGEENSFIKEEYDRILKSRKEEDPEFVKNYNDAMSSLNNEFFPDKIKKFAKDLFTGDVSPPKSEFDEILSLQEISVAELEDAEMQERLMEAITLKLYTENSGSVKLGNSTIDRYLFVRSYDMLDVPKSLMMGMWIYRTMCMGGLNIKAAITQASIIYTLDQVISKFIYYQIRRDIINM